MQKSHRAFLEEERRARKVPEFRLGVSLPGAEVPSFWGVFYKFDLVLSDGKIVG